MSGSTETYKKEYLVALYKLRSIAALISGVLVLLLTLHCVYYELQHLENWRENILHYFTFLSNLLATFASVTMLPYAIEGIRKKRFTMPDWMVKLQYSAATSVAITMTSALLIILPTQGMSALEGSNFWLHIVTPILTLCLFQCMETSFKLERKMIFLGQIPYWTYMVVYFYQVIIKGAGNGGWVDIYMVEAFWSVWISIALMLVLGFIVAAILFKLYNYRAAQSVKRISRLWSDELEPTELLIEAFGLGRYMGKRCGIYDLTVPVDIFKMMEERYGVSLEKLTKAFMRGALDSISGRDA